MTQYVDEENEQYTHEQIKELERLYGSSFFIFDSMRLRNNYQRMEAAFKSRYEHLIIGYSYKTNYLPKVCKEFANLGAYAEVVSRLEYDLALKIGTDPTQIIFNGPIKSKEDIFFALKNKSILHIDSLYEIQYVKEFARSVPDTLVKIGIRLNFESIENGNSTIQDGYSRSRFGICEENGDFEEALRELRSVNNIRVVGLHGHFSTSSRSVHSYALKTRKLCKLGKEFLGQFLEYIDIGGGMYGELPTSFNRVAPTFEEYAEAICLVMNEEFKLERNQPYLILEPGVSLVADIFSFVAKVMDVKKIMKEYFVLVDGSVHNVKPTMHKLDLPLKIISEKRNEGTIERFHIVGYTCMEKDYLTYDRRDYLPVDGDYIMYEHVGAYTIVLNPLFIKERPAVIEIEQGMVNVLRYRETFTQFFNEELYEFS